MAALHFTKDEFNKTLREEKLPVLVDFWAPWCGPCKMLGPVIDELADELKGTAVVGKVNVDEQEELAAKYGVMSIPTVIFIKNGQETGKLIGVRPKEELKKMLLG